MAVAITVIAGAQLDFYGKSSHDFFWYKFAQLEIFTSPPAARENLGENLNLAG